MTQLPNQGFQNPSNMRGASRPPTQATSAPVNTGGDGAPTVGAGNVDANSENYNFDSSGNVVENEVEIKVKTKTPKGGLLKLLILLAIPIGLASAVALFFVSSSQEDAYKSAKNVVMTIPMKSVNWQDLGVVFEPVVTLDIKTTSGYEQWEFLLDSGAVVSSLPRDWADKMGKDLSMMQRSTFRGFGNAKSFAYQGDMTVRIGEEDVNIPVVFTEAAGTKSLLGRKGFFQDYSVYFNSAEKQIEIRK